jgi:hypothetical protein
MVQLVRHRQPKESATDRLNLNHRVTPRLHNVGTPKTGRTRSRFWKYFYLRRTLRRPECPHSSRNKSAHHSDLLSSRSFDVDWHAVFWLLVGRGAFALEVSSLPSHVAKIRRRYPEQRHFHAVHQVPVLEDVPTEVVPGISPPLALIICRP